MEKIIILLYTRLNSLPRRDKTGCEGDWPSNKFLTNTKRLLTCFQDLLHKLIGIYPKRSECCYEMTPIKINISLN